MEVVNCCCNQLVAPLSICCRFRQYHSRHSKLTACCCRCWCFGYRWNFALLLFFKFCLENLLLRISYLSYVIRTWLSWIRLRVRCRVHETVARVPVPRFEMNLLASLVCALWNSLSTHFIMWQIVKFKSKRQFVGNNTVLRRHRIIGKTFTVLLLLSITNTVGVTQSN